MRTIRVDLGDKSYDIKIGIDILKDAGAIIRALGNARKAMIITNPTVNSYYGKTVQESLERNGFEVSIAEVPDGEEYKSLTVAASLYDRAIEQRLDRHSIIVALGGGVIGDMAGFVAATYLRGIPFVQIPTTLLAQVDSSVGGKVAVNHAKGKNLIGSFYQPKAVIIDPRTLKTLPAREIRTGLAEVIKYGVIVDKAFFAYLEENVDGIKELADNVMINIIATSCEAKARVVEKDEKEESLRAILNYGHTIGHALESVTDYKYYRHGEAIAIGMACAASIAVELGFFSQAETERQNALLKKVGLDIFFESRDLDRIQALILHDKKVKNGKVNFVLPTEIGAVKITDQVPGEVVEKVLNQYLKA